MITQLSMESRVSCVDLGDRGHMRTNEVRGVPRVGDFQEGPAAQAAVVVDRRDLVRLGGRGLGRLFAAVLAGHLDDEVERLGPAVVIADD